MVCVILLYYMKANICFSGSLVGTWKVYDINITNLAVLLYAYRSSNDTNSTYLWKGEVTGSAYVDSIGMNTTVKVTFDPIVGLTGVFVRVQDHTSFGEVMVDLTYTSANKSCEGNSGNAGVKVTHSCSIIYNLR